MRGHRIWSVPQEWTLQTSLHLTASPQTVDEAKFTISC